MPLDQQALIRSIGVSQGKYMLLLGAGASASSGVPTASQCIWEWKKEIFLSANPNLPANLFSDTSLPGVQAKIQSWLDQQGCFPPLGHETEYVHYIQECYPKSEDRSAYFNRRISGIIPEVGYQLLAMLHNHGVFQWIWTSNFDGLVRQSRNPEQAVPIKEIGLDSAGRIADLREGDRCGYLIALHGDYRYDSLKNTSVETQTLDDELCSALIARVRQQPLIVLGYGGGDQSIMQALETAVSDGCASGGIYWCARPADSLSPRVRNLIQSAKEKGIEADLVEIDCFDDFMLRIARYVFRTGQDAIAVEKLIAAAVPTTSEFRLTGYRADEDWVKGNALLIDLPEAIYQFEASGLTGWKELRAIIGTEPIPAGLLNGKVLAIGAATKISAVFAGRLTSKLDLVPLHPDEVSKSVVGGVLLDALLHAVSVGAGLEKKGHRQRILWDNSKFRLASHSGIRCRAYEAVKISLNRAVGRQFINLVPDLHVVREDGREIDAEAVKDVKRQLLGVQWNKQYNNAVEDWCDRILGEQDSRAYTFPDAPFDSFTFKLARPLAYARIMVRTSTQRPVSPKRPGECFEATVLEEPALVFGTARSPVHSKDPHPLRGILEHGPYDVELTRAGFYREVRLGIICPKSCEDPLQKYLGKLSSQHSTLESKAEYLLPFPGFQQAYRIPLRIPDRKEQEWRGVPIHHPGSTAISVQASICSSITREIDNLISSGSTDLVIIFVPKAWRPYETVDANDVRSDLHDYIKAYCAQRGVRTQFLREETLSKQLQCEILWWLAQAIYVKSLRTPFILQSNDSETVFVGIGYGMAKRKEKGIVLGCSHIYDAAGQGLRYHVSRIQNPMWIQDNPFLKKDDAINLGYQVRQLFHQTYHKLPRRVVIHKRTPFLISEQEGLAQSLSGIPELEMITIEEEPSWRFLAYDKVKQCVDGFPVKRNTILIYGGDQCLLWVHGAVRGIKDYKAYFQGKSRIPVPLRITRFSGQAPVETISREILGLSKMNWNSCDLYAQLPATLESSSAIARVGQLMSRFGAETYDYRLFI